MSTLAEFNSQVQKITKDFTVNQIRLLQIKISLEALRRIVLKMPVDTGRARGNWQTTINKIPDGEKFSDNPVVEGTATILAVPPFAVVNITNNVPYIVFLENGSSQQAANGMVGVTLEELKLAFI